MVYPSKATAKYFYNKIKMDTGENRKWILLWKCRWKQAKTVSGFYYGNVDGNKRKSQVDFIMEVLKETSEKPQKNLLWD